MLYNLVKNVNTFIDEMKSIGDDKVGENEWFELKFNEDLDQLERGSGAMNGIPTLNETFVSIICWLYSIDMVWSYMITRASNNISFRVFLYLFWVKIL